MLLSPLLSLFCFSLFLFNAPSTTDIYTLSLHDALPIYIPVGDYQFCRFSAGRALAGAGARWSGLGRVVFQQQYLRSEEHTSELQSLRHLVCRLLLEKKKQK